MVGELTGLEVRIGDSYWTTGCWVSSVLPLLKNPPSKHLVFEESELDKQELGVDGLKLGLGALTGEITGSMVGELTGLEVRIGDSDWTTGCLGALTGEITRSMVGELTGLEVRIGDSYWTTGCWVSSVLPLLKNPPSKHLVFEESELDKQELGKLEVGKPRVDKQGNLWDPNSGKIQPLLDVQGKGKKKVVDEQAAHDLLTLQTPKIKSPADRFIF
nr:hypothetical protein [Tanacetum cinerariifolium]